MASWLSILLFLIILISLSSFAIFLKRKYKKIKPFKLPPGPPGLPIIGSLHLLGDLPHHDLHRLAEKYGPIMHLKLGLIPTIVVSSPEAAKLFLKTHDLVFATRPKTEAAKHISYGQKGLIFAEYGQYWRSIRKLCTLELLTSSKVEMFKPIRSEELRNLVQVLKVAGDAGEVVDLSAKVEKLIEDLSYRMIFGSKDDRFNFKKSVQEVARLAGTFNISDFLPFLKPFDPQGLVRRSKTVSKDLDEKLNKIVGEHIKNAREKQRKEKDFVDIMLSLMESNNVNEVQLDLDNIKAIVFDMLGAAMDTSTNVILWAFPELMRHPHVMKQVQDELRHVIGMDRMVDETDLVKLKYLNMVIKESMRLHPVTPLLHHSCREDVSVNDYYIPKNSRLLVNVWKIGRDPDAWSDDAEEFDPSRFANSDIDVFGHDLQLIPFGSGRRSCPGIQMGLRVVQLVLAQLLHCFNWELPHGLSPCDLDMSEKFGLVVSRAEHLLVMPTFRLNVN